jgi:hypothetical protein
MSQLLLFREQSLPLSPSKEIVAELPSPTPPVVVRSRAAAGVCRFCGCRGDFCVDRTGERCELLGPSRTCCSAEPCRAKANLQKAPRAEKPQAKPRPRRSYTAAAAFNRWLTN